MWDLIGVISCLPVSGGIGSSQKGNLRFPDQAAAFRAGDIRRSRLPATAFESNEPHRATQHGFAHLVDSSIHL
jgi:hypothetical protein